MPSDKRQKWLTEYLQCWDATEAARRAEYKWPNKQGPALKKELADEIQAAIDENMMSAGEALTHITEIARGSIGPGFFFSERTITVLDKDKKAVEIKETGLDWQKIEQYGRLIKSISFTANGPRIELYDRLKSLEDIGKVHGLFDRGSEDKPLTVNNINYSVDEWQQEQQRRRAEVTKTLEIFDDETTD
jgi:hypothetical protein